MALAALQRAVDAGATTVSLSSLQLSELAPLLPLLEELPRLEALDLTNNRLRKLPRDLSSLSSLHRLELTQQAAGPLPLASVLHGLASLPALDSLAIDLPTHDDAHTLLQLLPRLRLLNGRAARGAGAAAAAISPPAAGAAVAQPPSAAAQQPPPAAAPSEPPSPPPPQRGTSAPAVAAAEHRAAPLATSGGDPRRGVSAEELAAASDMHRRVLALYGATLQPAALQEMLAAFDAGVRGVLADLAAALGDAAVGAPAAGASPDRAHAAAPRARAHLEPPPPPPSLPRSHEERVADPFLAAAEVLHARQRLLALVAAALEAFLRGERAPGALAASTAHGDAAAPAVATLGTAERREAARLHARIRAAGAALAAQAVAAARELHAFHATAEREAVAALVAEQRTSAALRGELSAAAAAARQGAPHQPQLGRRASLRGGTLASPAPPASAATVAGAVGASAPLTGPPHARRLPSLARIPALLEEAGRAHGLASSGAGATLAAVGSLKRPAAASPPRAAPAPLHSTGSGGVVAPVAPPVGARQIALWPLASVHTTLRALLDQSPRVEGAGPAAAAHSSRAPAPVRPRGTLEERVYLHASEAMAGVRPLAAHHAASLLHSTRAYAPFDVECALFQAIVRNDVDEGHAALHAQVRASALALRAVYSEAAHGASSVGEQAAGEGAPEAPASTRPPAVLLPLVPPVIGPHAAARQPDGGSGDGPVADAEWGFILRFLLSDGDAVAAGRAVWHAAARATVAAASPLGAAAEASILVRCADDASTPPDVAAQRAAHGDGPVALLSPAELLALATARDAHVSRCLADMAGPAAPTPGGGHEAQLEAMAAGALAHEAQAQQQQQQHPPSGGAGGGGGGAELVAFMAAANPAAVLPWRVFEAALLRHLLDARRRFLSRFAGLFRTLDAGSSGYVGHAGFAQLAAAACPHLAPSRVAALLGSALGAGGGAGICFSECVRLLCGEEAGSGKATAPSRAECAPPAPQPLAAKRRTGAAAPAGLASSCSSRQPSYLGGTAASAARRQLAAGGVGVATGAASRRSGEEARFDRSSRRI